jgi:RNA polymerase sigma factor (sigma-70 family)
VTEWSPDVWNDLLQRYSRPLAIYAAQFCSEAEDIVQDTFLELFRQPSPPENLSAWLYKVVRNKSISARQSRKRRDRYEQIKKQTRESWFEENPENQLDARLITSQLRELPDGQREVVVLRLWSNLTFTEIDDLTQSSSSTCHRLYQTAIDELRKQAGIPCPNSNP